MSDKKPFLVPVVIDDTRERGASVPDKLHEVQWTRLPGGETSPAFVQRVQRLLTLQPSMASGPATSAAAPAVREQRSLKDRRCEERNDSFARVSRLKLMSDG
jgi:hypothetical protein